MAKKRLTIGQILKVPPEMIRPVPPIDLASIRDPMRDAIRDEIIQSLRIPPYLVGGRVGAGADMTESAWLASRDCSPMLAFLTASNRSTPLPPSVIRPSDRKLRLWLLACGEWFAVNEGMNATVAAVACNAVGRWIDGERSADVVGQMSGDVATRTFYQTIIQPHIFSDIDRNLPAAYADLARDVFGNPFRPLSVSRGPGYPAKFAIPTDRADGWREWDHETPKKWLTPAVVGVAGTIYAERRFAETPILADALEEAGVPAASAILHHLRDYSPCPECTGESDSIRIYCKSCENSGRMGWVRKPVACVRGCWALDLILGKS